MTGRDAVEFRDVARGRALQGRLDRLLAGAGRAVTVMHVCGSHEQAIARFGLRARFPLNLRVQMGPGCPVCVTDSRGHRRLRRPGPAGGADPDLRRHAARAGGRAVARGRPRRRRARRRPVRGDAGRGDRAEQRRAGRLLRHRVRDHGGGDRRRAAARSPSEPVRALRAQVGARRDGDGGAKPGLGDRGLPRRGPRRDHHRVRPVRAVRAHAPEAGRGGRLRAARHPLAWCCWSSRCWRAGPRW